MFIKRILRKPFLPALIFATILVGLIIISMLENILIKNKNRLDDLYRSITIECNLIPQDYIGAEFSLRPGIADRIIRMKEIGEYYGELKCPYYLKNPIIYKSNNPVYNRILKRF